MNILITIMILLIIIVSTIIGFVLIIQIIKLVNQLIKYFKLSNIKLKLELGIKENPVEIKVNEENNEITTESSETGWL
ncbi:hypothetical protein LT335_00775 [Spiroplasma sp. JKS002669]|uniref:hypothetical protein n=1 Tax=Spiroplasma attinicola TaxID=2904537 RepID=UPI0020C073AA|nr:hypothetical protein [Spiroplasma sp. JKS002669]MCL6429209.1 hypothetical protein [Spiroplasma sp. JKS002669]